MFSFDRIFNEKTLNIFTDASVYKDSSGYTISCPGALCVTTCCSEVNILDKDCGEKNLIFNSTNNDGEISAINLGLFYAIRYGKMFENFNLFSDSNICIQGLTNWIFNWFNNINSEGLMISSSGKPVANQSVISSIYNTIIEMNIPINLYHQKGHVKIDNETLLKKAHKDFKVTNNITEDIDLDIIKCISFYNDIVDVETKDTISRYLRMNGADNFVDTQKPLVFTPKIESKNIYKKLINNKRW